MNLRSESQHNILVYECERRQEKLEASSLLDEINPLRYYLAVLSEGMGELKARLFLAKIGICVPSKYNFYLTQHKFGIKIEKFTRDLLDYIRKNLPPNTVYGIDCSWSGRKNAEHAIVILMDIRTRLIFDCVIILRDPKVSHFKYDDASNMMELYTVKSIRD